LNDVDSDDAMEAFCRRAGTPFGTVAAVCVHPQFIDLARRTLERESLSGRVRVATVVNFPEGDQDADQVVRTIASALVAGADEIDLVFPWRTLRDSGDSRAGHSLVAAARAACPDRLL